MGLIIPISLRLITQNYKDIQLTHQGGDKVGTELSVAGLSRALHTQINVFVTRKPPSWSGPELRRSDGK